jgi:hypothetical protein
MPADLITAAELAAAWPDVATLPELRQAALPAAASAVVSAACRRVLGFDVHDEVLRLDGTRIVRLGQYPVSTVTSVEIGPTGARTLLAVDSYALLRGGRTGEIDLAGGSSGVWSDCVPAWAIGRAEVRVVYEAGYVAETDPDHPERIVCPADLKEAAILTAQALAQAVGAGNLRSVSLGEYSYTVADGGATGGVPALAQGILGRYRRKRPA